MATKRDSAGKFKKGHTGAGKPGRKKGATKTGGRKKGITNKVKEIQENVEAITHGIDPKAVNEAFNQALTAKSVEDFNNTYERLHTEGSPMQLLAHQLVARALRKEQAAANYLMKHVVGDPLEIKQREAAREALRTALQEIQPLIQSGQISIERLQDWEVRHRPDFLANESAERIFNDTINSIKQWVSIQQQQIRLENEAMFREQSLLMAQQTKLTRKQIEAWVELNYEVMERFAADPVKAAGYYRDRLERIIPEFLAPGGDVQQITDATWESADNQDQTGE